MPDAIVTHLNELGYQPVFLPVTGVRPPDVYGSAGGRLVRHGPLIDYLRDRRTIEIVEEQAKAPDITHVHTSRKRFNASLKFLAAALRCLGVAYSPQFSLSALRDTRLVFSVANVSSISVSGGRIQRLLEFVDPSLARHAGLDGGDLHVAYEYLYAERLLIRRTRQGDTQGAASLAVADFAELETDAHVVQEDECTVAFASPSGERVAFAYRAGWLRLAGALWTFVPSVVISATAGPTGPKYGPYIPTPGQVLWAEPDGGVEENPR